MSLDCTILGMIKPCLDLCNPAQKRRNSMKINRKPLFGLLVAFLLGVWVTNISVAPSWLSFDGWLAMMLFGGMMLVLATANGRTHWAMFVSVLGAIIAVFGLILTLSINGQLLIPGVIIADLISILINLSFKTVWFVKDVLGIKFD